MCDNDCKVLINCVKEISSMIHDLSRCYYSQLYGVDVRENRIIDHFIMAISGHRSECVQRSINIVVTTKIFCEFDINVVLPITLIELAVYEHLFKFLSVLLKYYGGENFNKSVLKCTMGYRILRDIYMTYSDRKKIRCREIFESGPKPYGEYMFFKQIFGEINGHDLWCIIKNINIFTIRIFELLLEYGANLDYCHDPQHGRASLLVHIILAEDFYWNRYSREICTLLLSRYNFMMEGHGIDYTYPHTKQKLNVLEFAQLIKFRTLDDHQKRLCKKIINYFTYRQTVDEINKIIPFPIAEEIIPNIIRSTFE